MFSNILQALLWNWPLQTGPKVAHTENQTYEEDWWDSFAQTFLGWWGRRRVARGWLVPSAEWKFDIWEYKRELQHSQEPRQAWEATHGWRLFGSFSLWNHRHREKGVKRSQCVSSSCTFSKICFHVRFFVCFIKMYIDLIHFPHMILSPLSTWVEQTLFNSSVENILKQYTFWWSTQRISLICGNTFYRMYNLRNRIYLMWFAKLYIL